VTPAHLPDLGLPWFSISIRAIHVAHDDMGRPAAITSGQFAKWDARGSQRPYLVG
jgi:hypothetical protein